MLKLKFGECEKNNKASLFTLWRDKLGPHNCEVVKSVQPYEQKQYCDIEIQCKACGSKWTQNAVSVHEVSALGGARHVE